MKGFKFRLEPNETQKKQIQETLDSARFVYNRFLDLNEYAYQTEGIHLSYAMMCSLLTDLKQDPEYPWLKQADSMALQTALKDLDEAFQNFFTGRAKYPKFKTKKRACYVKKERSLSRFPVFENARCDRRGCARIIQDSSSGHR